MKVFTFRLGQFAVCGLVLTVLFRYALNLYIKTGNMFTPWLCAIIYFILMYVAGWHFGKKDAMENEIHDLGFRQHLTTYLLCTGVAYATHQLGWDVGSHIRIAMTVLFWGIGLFVHFILFLMAQRKTIKGYAREEIFQ